jgi:hypothetical protein
VLKGTAHGFDVTRGGKRLLMVLEEPETVEKPSTITVVENWLQEFKEP